MAFEIYNWSCVSSSLNQGLTTAAIATPTSNSSVAQGSMNLFSYYSVGDALATIEASNYFLPVIYDLKTQDVIMVTGSDASIFLQVETVTLPADGSSGTVTVQSFTPAGTVGTSNITNLAVTTAKIANNAVTATQIANNTVDFGQIALDVAASATVALTAAQINGMYATPVQLIAAPGAGKLILIEAIIWDIAFVSAQYAAGGAIQAQYGNTVHGAGSPASASLAAGTLNGVAASGFLANASGASVLNAPATVENTAVYLSNATGAFTTGDSTVNLYIRYRVITPA